MKKLGLAAAIIFGAIVVVFCLFTFIRCGEKPKNYLSQLHMLVAPAKGENHNWLELRDLMQKRCGNLGDFRIFEVKENRYAVVEITGSKDPNMIASMLIMKGEPSLLDDTGTRIASGKDILQAGIMLNDNVNGIYFGVQLSEGATERIAKILEALKPNQKYKIDLFVDGIKTLTTKLTKADIQPQIVFSANKNTEPNLLDYLGQAITYRYPYELAVDKNNSFFIPPLSDKPGYVDFQDIIGKIVIHQQ